MTNPSKTLRVVQRDLKRWIGLMKKDRCPVSCANVARVMALLDTAELYDIPEHPAGRGFDRGQHPIGDLPHPVIALFFTVSNRTEPDTYWTQSQAPERIALACRASVWHDLGGEASRTENEGAGFYLFSLCNSVNAKMWEVIYAFSWVQTHTLRRTDDLSLRREQRRSDPMRREMLEGRKVLHEGGQMKSHFMALTPEAIELAIAQGHLPGDMQVLSAAAEADLHDETWTTIEFLITLAHREHVVRRVHARVPYQRLVVVAE